MVTITNLGTSVVGYNDLNDISMSRTFGEMVMCGVSMSRDIQVNVGLTLAEITFFFSLIYNNRDSFQNVRTPLEVDLGSITWLMFVEMSLLQVLWLSLGNPYPVPVDYQDSTGRICG